MAFENTNHVWLGIPIPRSVQQLPKTPPVCFYHSGDIEALQLLRDFGRKWNRTSDEIDQACNLASGPSDIVIILERPGKNHNYKLTFGEFVKSCKTLGAVDELIRLSSNGARSIHTVTILDAFSFKPDKDNQHPADELCHKLLAEILKTKRPKVIIQCHREAYEDEWMSQVKNPTNAYGFDRRAIQIDGNYPTTVFYSFHPSRAVNYAAQFPEYRCLLMYHFIAAFGKLGAVSQLPSDAEKIQKFCIKNKDENNNTLPEWRSPATSLTAILKHGVLTPSIRRLVDLEKFRLTSTLKALPTMYAQLSSLASGDDNVGSFGIANAIVFLWKDQFRSNPLYEQVTAMLRLRGSEQHNWFKHEAEDDPLVEHALSKLHFNDCKPSGWISVPFDLPDAVEINKRVTDRAYTALLGSLGLQEVALVNGNKMAQKHYLEIIDLVESQNTIMNNGIRKSTLAQLHGALRVCELVDRCGTLVKIFKLEDYFLESSDIEKIRHLTLLVEVLRELRLMWK